MPLTPEKPVFRRKKGEAPAPEPVTTADTPKSVPGKKRVVAARAARAGHTTVIASKAYSLLSRVKF